MARFQFSLQPVLDARHRVEQKKQREFAEIQARRQELEQQLRTYQSHLASDKSELRADLHGSIDVQALRLRAGASLHVMRKAQRIVLELAGVHKQLERARNDLLEASRQRRAVELLRDKRYEQWLAEQKRVEAAALDEMAVMRAGARPFGAAEIKDESEYGHESRVGSTVREEQWR